ncbi:hypothetical protein [Rubrivirga sp. IMCC45206]|uniref:hypothetical protein n=1 Tax=Rubrivirga sp. IMCC45206 TaxID=3391614 RepID=UPI00398FE1E8
MTASPTRPLAPVGVFAGLASAAYLVGALVIVPALARVAQPDVLAAALAVDLVVLVPLAYAALVARVSGRWWTLAPVVALSLGATWLVLPDAHRGVLDVALLALPVLEVGAGLAVVWAFARAVRSGASGDPYERLRAAAARVLPNAAGRALAYELAVGRYALGPLAAPPAGAFPGRRASGYGTVLAGIAVAAAMELVGGHVLVRHLWGDGAALVHLALSGYAIVWLVGDWRALGARPTTLDGDTLHVRCGLRWTAAVPVAAIEAVYHVRRPLPADRPTVRATAGTPQFALDLRKPVVAEGPYGLRRTVTRVALSVDDPDRFVAALAVAMGGRALGAR